jgi:abhydrolase domain-containing protein 17
MNPKRRRQITVTVLAWDSKYSGIMMPIGKILQPLLYYVACFWIILNLYGWFFANYLLFKPPAKPYKLQPWMQMLPLKSQNHGIVLGVLPQPKAKWTVLVSHGNGDDLWNMYPFLQTMQEQGYQVVAYDYSGYGLSGGNPSEQQSYLDAAAAYQYVRDRLKVPSNRILLYGHSLGGGVAFHLAEKYPAAGLIVEGTFVSAYRTVTYKRIIFYDPYPSQQRLANIHMPILLLHGLKDRVVAPWHSQALFSAYSGKKKLYWLPEAGHNQSYLAHEKEYWHYWRKFTQDLEEVKA